MNFKDRLSDEYGYAEDVIKRVAAIKEEGRQSLVMEAMNYALLAGGKRLRPILMHSVFTALNGKEKRKPLLERYMAAIELIHSYSLVHDDLPEMDNDELRRGKPTVHVKYGADMAVLTGDALLNRAFEVASDGFLFCTETQDYECAAKALSILSGKAGIYGMAGGQVIDVQAEKRGLELDTEGLLLIFSLKTAALIEASMTIGAVLSGAGKEKCGLIEEAARNIGIAFQIEDDILDVTGTEAELGKPIGSDERNKKTTYVTLKGLEAAKEDARAYSLKALDTIGSMFTRNDFLYELVNSLIGRRA